MRLGRGLAALTVALGLTTITACGGGSGDPVAWTDSVCGALLKFGEAAKKQPTFDSSDPASAVNALDGYLGNLVTAANSSIDSIKAAGPSPVKGGDEFATGLTRSLTDVKTSFQAARDQIAEIDTADPASIATALPAAIEPLNKIDQLPDPLDSVQGNAELDAAAAKAPNCKALDTA